MTELEVIAHAACQHMQTDEWHNDSGYWGLARAIQSALTAYRDSDGTASAALCEDIAVPQDCQARAEGIAQPLPSSDKERE